MHGDNPAGRLLAIIEEVKKYKPDTPTKTVWMQVLRVPENDFPQLLIKMGAMMELPSQVVEDLKEKYPRQHSSKAYAHFYASVNRAFSRLDFNTTINAFNNTVDDNAINYLSATADLLEAKGSTKPLSKAEIIDLQKKVQGLMDFVRQSDISSELKHYLLEKLTRAMEAIDKYFITGSSPIVDAVESALGHAAFNEEYRSKLKMTGWQIFSGGLATIANIATIASGSVGLTESTIKFLEELAS